MIVGGVRYEETRYGFRFGAALFERCMSLPNGRVVLRVVPDVGKPLDVYVSETGRSVRVFRGGKELRS